MPAAIFLTREQVRALAELDEDVVINEFPPAERLEKQTVDVWVMDENSTWSSEHRSVIIDEDGNTLGDETISE